MVNLYTQNTPQVGLLPVKSHLPTITVATWSFFTTNSIIEKTGLQPERSCNSAYIELTVVSPAQFAFNCV